MGGLIELLMIVVVSFAGGYAVRDWQSRRRRAAERKKFHERHPEFGP